MDYARDRGERTNEKNIEGIKLPLIVICVTRRQQILVGKTSINPHRINVLIHSVRAVGDVISAAGRGIRQRNKLV